MSLKILALAVDLLKLEIKAYHTMYLLSCTFVLKYFDLCSLLPLPALLCSIVNGQVFQLLVLYNLNLL